MVRAQGTTYSATAELFCDNLRAAKDHEAAFLLGQWPLLHALREMARNTEDALDEEKKRLRNASIHECELNIGSLVQQKQQTDTWIVQQQPTADGWAEKIRQNTTAMTDHKRNIDANDAEIARLRQWNEDHKDEVYIPFYGIKVAVDIDKNTETMNRLIGDRNTWAEEYNKLNGETAGLNSQLSTLNGELLNARARSSDLEDRRKVEEDRRQTLDASWVQHSHASLAAKCLTSTLDNLDLRDSPRMLVGKLSESVVIGQGSAPLERALLELAGRADQLVAEGHMAPAQPTGALSEAATVEVNGFSVRQVTYAATGEGGPKGRFRQNGDSGDWVEGPPVGDQVWHTFKQTARDEWSVYLTDQSRGYSVRLDLWTNMVMGAGDGTAEAQLYTVIGSSAD